MNPIYVDINKMDKIILQLGFVGENERTRIIFQCGSMFAEYPNAVPALSVQAPKGSPYPVIITRDGNNVIWDVKDSSLTVHGSGEVQLTFTENGKVAKSFRCKTNIEKSTVPKGNEPDPIQDFVVEAETLLDGIPEQIAAALQAAKESHEFDGQDGVSPTVTTSPISGGHSVNITDRTGNHEFTVMNGQDGISPDITVTDIQGGHRVKIVDVSGTNTFDIPDGNPATLIDDTTASASKTYSSSKVDEMNTQLLNAIQGVDDSINSIENKIYFPYGKTANTIYIKAGIDGTTGQFESDDKQARTAVLGTDDRKGIGIQSETYYMRVFAYVEYDPSLIFDRELTKGWTQNKIVNIPNDCIYIIVAFKRSDDSDMANTDADAIKNALTWYVCTDKTLSKENIPADAYAVKNAIEGISASDSIVKLDYTVVANETIDATNGGTSTSSVSSRTDFIDISGFKEVWYKRQTTTNGNATVGVAFYTELRSYISGITSLVLSQAVGYYKELNRAKVPANAKYMRCTIYTNTTTYGEFEIYGCNNLSLLLENKTEYKNIYTADDSVSLVSTFDGVIALYDDLVQKYPEVLSKNTLTSGSITNYEYVFTIGNYNTRGDRSRDSEIKKPVVLITSGVHGYERSSVMSLYTFVKSLCERDETLSGIAYDVEYRFIPVCCPWGYTNDSRLNQNGVNINRNFDSSDWVLTEPGLQYSGAAPGDQDETKIVQGWVEDHYSDAILLVDLHNSEYLDEITCVLGANDSDTLALKKKYLVSMNNIIQYWITNRCIIPSKTYAYTGNTTTGGTLKSYGKDKGLVSFTFEMSWNVANTGLHSNPTIGTGAEGFANMMLGFKDYFDQQ